MKKRTVLIFLLLQLSYGLYAQRKEQLINALKTQNTISGVLACLDTFWTDIGSEPFKSPVNLHFDQTRLDFEFSYYSTSEKGEKKIVSRSYRLNILHDRDSIKYMSIQIDKRFPKGYIDQGVLINDDLAITKIVNTHNLNLHTSIGNKRYLKALFDDEELEFGCGEAGQDFSKTALKLVKCVKRNRKRVFMAWLQSPSAELQACGIIGIYQLIKKGVPVTETESNLINYIYSINPNVEFCSGCIGGMYSTIKEYTLRGH